jgi:hypothetical protein
MATEECLINYLLKKNDVNIIFGVLTEIPISALRFTPHPGSGFLRDKNRNHKKFSSALADQSLYIG